MVFSLSSKPTCVLFFNEKMKGEIRTLGWDVNESSVYISNEKGNSVSDSCPEMNFYYNF